MRTTMRRSGLLLCVLLVDILNTGQSLDCFKCEIGFWDLCVTTTTNCSADELCYEGNGKAADVLDIKVKGCLVKEACNKTTVVEFLANKTLYSMTTTCCDQNLCNSSSVLQPSLASFLLSLLALAKFYM